MCGIVGYIGKKAAEEIVLEGLKNLEYRGYDSSGLSIIDGNKMNTVKKAGRISNLEEALKDKFFNANIGIGHTRWATHGFPTDINAHPHMDENEEFSIVHNGILENYIDLKENFIKEGVRILSDTDSEIIAHLISQLYDGDLLSSAMKITEKMKGAYALGIISTKEPNTLIGIKKKNPLVVGISEHGFFIVSDISAVLKYTKKFIYLEEGDIVKLTPENYEIWNDGKKIEREIVTVDRDIESITKGGYEHFMIKEIFEQPEALNETISHRIENNHVKFEENFFTAEELKNIEKIVIIGCGTAYHAGLSGKIALKKLVDIPTTVEIASEFNYSEPEINSNILAIFVSQSGETSDTMTALRLAKKKGAKTLAITNVVGSSISRVADKVLYTWAGPEISVASTKAYTTQVALLFLVSVDMARKLNKIDAEKEIELCQALLT